MNKDYVPFGKEWENEMMKMKKTDIVAMLKTELTKNKAENKKTTIYGMDIIEIDNFEGVCILTNEQFKRLRAKILDGYSKGR